MCDGQMMMMMYMSWTRRLLHH